MAFSNRFGRGKSTIITGLEEIMKSSARDKAEGKLRETKGKVGWILLWLLGIPLPILLLLYLLRGCT
jgi:hypothetical protein